MHPYIPYLLADIAAAHRLETDIPNNISSRQAFEEEMEEIEKWIAGEEAPCTFGHWCGLEATGFPPPEQLSNQDMLTVCQAFDRMMYSWNLSIDLPDKFPEYLQYNFRVNTLNEKTAIINSGMMHFDYCTGYAPDCVFKEYCPCLEMWNKPINENLGNSLELPADKMPEDKPFYDPEDPEFDLPF